MSAQLRLTGAIPQTIDDTAPLRDGRADAAVIT